MREEFFAKFENRDQEVEELLQKAIRMFESDVVTDEEE